MEILIILCFLYAIFYPIIKGFSDEREEKLLEDIENSLFR